MSNKFDIEITAHDKATRVFNDLIGRGKHLDRALSTVNETAQRGAEIFRSMVPSMSALAGMGSIAGLGAMTKRFGDSSMSLSNMADNLGLTTTKLQELHGAAQLTGLSVGSIDSSMKSLGTTMENALYNRDNNALTTFRALGIEMHKTAKGGPDVHRALLDISNAVRKLTNPQAQEALASSLGVSELLPLLRQGSAGIEELEKRSEQLGMVQDQASIQGGKNLYESLTQLDGAATGLGNAIASGLAPSVSSIAKGTGEWVAENRQLISEDVAGWANDVGKAFGYAQGKTADLLEGMHNLTIAAGDKTNKDPTSLNFLSAWMNRYAQWQTGDPNETWGGMIFDATHKPYDPNRQANGMTLDKTGHRMWSGDYEPVGIRQNNPGNLRHWPGAYTASNGIAVFATKQAGISALASNLETYNQKYGIDTVRGIVSRWAPPGENNTRAYIDDVSRRTGFSPDQRLNMHDLSTMTKLTNAIIWHENGQNRYDPNMLRSAVSQGMQVKASPHIPAAPQVMDHKVSVEVTLHNAPQGTHARVTSDHSATVRINHAMPGVNTP